MPISPESITSIKEIDRLEKILLSVHQIPKNLSFCLEFSPMNWRKICAEITGYGKMIDLGVSEFKWTSQRGLEWTLKLKSYKYK